jgi:protein-S-isoprenylcysteine O-methyltransferase Ste14
LNEAVLELILLNYALMWTLALGYFRRSERPPLAWWLTGLHFFAVPAVLLLAQTQLLPGLWWSSAPFPLLREGVAVLLSAGSLVLLALTRGNQRVRLSQWHLENDAPEMIVTWGPHGVVRHPFYVGYILGAGAACFVAPGFATLLLLLYTVAALAFTARREERRLLASALGAEYAAYRVRTGAFWPQWRGHDHA